MLSLCGAGLLVAAALVDLRSAAPNDRRAGDWRAYGADLANTKYSPLDRITRDNVRDLRLAWRWRSADEPILDARPDPHTFLHEATPVMADGTLYTVTSLSQVAAIDPVSGRTRWTHDPKAYDADRAPRGDVRRRRARRSHDRAAASDRPRELLRHLSPDRLPRRRHRRIVGARSGGASGRASRRRPRVRRAHGTPALDLSYDGEPGSETWENGSNERTGNANAWTIMSADEELGYVYLPVSTPTSDFYGGHRPGANVYADSLVAVEAATGKRVWHFQTVYHGLWDYDPPAAPVLATVRIDGKPRRIAAQVTKQGFCFVVDRLTGEPIWPVVERGVPAAAIAGERAWATQPFPARPAPFERQGLADDDLIDFTPELRAEARDLLRKHHHGPLYTPPSEGSTIMLPGWVGGASWSGAGFDPDTGLLYVQSITAPFIVTLERPGRGTRGQGLDRLDRGTRGSRGQALDRFDAEHADRIFASSAVRRSPPRGRGACR